VSCCFAALRQLRQIRRYVPTSTFQKLVVAVVHSRLDYGNGVLVGIPAHLMRRLQSVLNAAARLIFNLKRSDHITDALVSIHWLALCIRRTLCRHVIIGTPVVIFAVLTVFAESAEYTKPIGCGSRSAYSIRLQY